MNMEVIHNLSYYSLEISDTIFFILKMFVAAGKDRTQDDYV